MKVLLKLKICAIHPETVELIKRDFPNKTDDELGLYFNPADQRYYEKGELVDSPYEIVDMTPEEYEYHVKVHREIEGRTKKQD